jgi:hypothetical protein
VSKKIGTLVAGFFNFLDTILEKIQVRIPYGCDLGKQEEKSMIDGERS